MTAGRMAPVVFAAVSILCAASIPSNAGDRTPNCLDEYISTMQPNAVAYVGLYSESEHYDCDVMLQGGFMPFEVWVWFVSSSVGVQAAEYKLTLPPNVIAGTVTTNPDIQVSLGDIWSGISLAFGPCQNGWAWTQYATCFLTSTATGFVLIEASPAAGALQIASCELGYPLYPATVLNHLAINMACTCPPELPTLSGVTVLGPSRIRAQFTMCVKDGMPPGSFALRNKANALDSIVVAQTSRVGTTAYDLGLQSPMSDSTTYVLTALWNRWSCSELVLYPGQSEFEFRFLEATAVEHTSWGAIKSLYGN